MTQHRIHLTCAAVAAAVALTAAGCAGTQQVRTARRTQVDAGAGSLESTRKALEGAWTLVSLEVVDARGEHRPIKATGRLTYDAFGTMTIRGVIDDPAVRDKLVLDYEGRIVIDTVKSEFRAADLTSDRPVDSTQIAPISPDKVRRYQLSGDSFVVTYVDASGNPTAVTRWQRTA